MVHIPRSLPLTDATQGEPSGRPTVTRPTVLTPEQASSAVALARHAPTRLIPDLAKGYGISARYLQLLVQADQMGEEFDWFTRQRRDRHVMSTAELVSRRPLTTLEVPMPDFDDRPTRKGTPRG